MRLTNKQVTDTIVEAIGEEALKLVDFLKNRKNISEFIVSEKTKTEIHAVRNTLYKLQRLNLATYKRKKDSKKGYYISYWTYHPKRVKDVIENMRKRKLEQLKGRLEKEEANKNCFFICQNACIRLDFDQGADISFKCPECGSLLIQQDNTRTIDNIKETIRKIEAAA